MKLSNVRLLVSDFGAATKFWHEVMGLHVVYTDESMGYAYFEVEGGGVELILRKGWWCQPSRLSRRDIRRCSSLRWTTSIMRTPSTLDAVRRRWPGHRIGQHGAHVRPSSATPMAILSRFIASCPRPE